jgi:hypothetical protein
MDPYLERPSLWPDVHLELIRAIRLALTQAVAPRYYVTVEERMYIATVSPQTLLGRADAAVIGAAPKVEEAAATYAVAGVPVPVFVPIEDEIHERFLEVREQGSNRLITVLEVLSPSNKHSGQGRTSYEEKRRQILYSATNLVEIDLLRVGEPLPVYPMLKSDYRILISRAWERPHSLLYAFNLVDPIPDVPIPLQADDDEPILALNPILRQIYADVRYDLRIDYTQPPPEPALPPETAEWLKQVLRG